MTDYTDLARRAADVRGDVGGLCIRRGRDWAGTDADSMFVRAQTSEDGSGGFEGWGVVYGVRDSYGTIFQTEAFTKGGLDEGAYPLLWMHNAAVPLATFVAEERPEGVWIAGEYDPTPDGQAARARALSGSAPELSVGFIWLEDGGEDATDLIVSARLVETSQITLRMASVPGAQIVGVRDDKTADDLDVWSRALVDGVRNYERALAMLRLAEVTA